VDKYSQNAPKVSFPFGLLSRLRRAGTLNGERKSPSRSKSVKAFCSCSISCCPPLRVRGAIRWRSYKILPRPGTPLYPSRNNHGTPFYPHETRGSIIFLPHSLNACFVSFAINPPWGAAEPRCRIRLLGRAWFERRGGIALRSELRSYIIRHRGGVYSNGPLPGGSGFGHFCRNKSASACGRTPRKTLNRQTP